MIILDSSAYYKLGRNAILQDDFDKALGYFIKAGDYHSQINATVLLCFFCTYNLIMTCGPCKLSLLFFL